MAWWVRDSSTLLATLCMLVAARTLPFATWAAFRLHGHLVEKCLLWALVLVPAAICIVARFYRFDIFAVTFALLYDLVLCWVLLDLCNEVQRKPPGLFLALMLVFVVAPALALPMRSAPRSFVVVSGFELALSAYSLWHFRVRDGARGTRIAHSDGLFFLLVNPEVVFPGEGAHCRPNPARGGLRVSFGIASMLVTFVAGAELARFTKPAIQLADTWSGLVYGAGAFLVLYGGHASLAHLQIGLCKIVGYEAPERYAYPFLARTPREFWQRWNRYILAWLRAHVHIALWRRLKGKGAVARTWMSGIGVFLWIGVIHDVCQLISKGRTTWILSVAFALWGLQLVAWSNFESAVGRGKGRVLYHGVSRALVLASIFLSAWACL